LAGDSGQRLIRTPVPHLVTALDIVHKIERPVRNRDSRNRNELLEVGQVADNESGLVVASKQLS
jgi:hypothetical protein